MSETMRFPRVAAVLAGLAVFVGALMAVLFTAFVLTFPFENRPAEPNPRNEWALVIASVGLLPAASLLTSLLLARWRLAGASLSAALAVYAAWALLLYGLDGFIEF